MLRSLLLSLLLLFGLSKAELIRVFAAADLQYALKEIADIYQKQYPEDKVELIFGSSGKGTAQIKSGAPYHLFFSADMKYVEELYREGYVVTKPKPYAVGRLVVWVRKDSGLDPSKFPQVLFQAKKIAIANWEHAPYGRAAKQVLENYGVFDKVKDKLVLGENVSQTASYVYSGSADVGLIPLSLAISENMKKAGNYWLVPEDKHAPIVQGYGITKVGENSQAVRRFYEFVGSPQARKIFVKYGFVLPGEK
ncbi:MAG: molybdate ABC transporter substrate-binding protein [Hydrogenobacter thermophilus]|uniref:molybdate ABC transporter substrate-binding protein n=1 Tax=Hydrogenobacter thermophilus TaxID=940 RepID=UPI001C75597F|nr:molybdate ABC transporter substrate-binding protein [Hydrogenobacter thermophilus]QWK20646.1 MAG: molybdate ABC transporter substrate-binding protein [Hydrogenobacter thermophilus]